MNDDVSCPSLSLVVRWFRETHNLHITVECYSNVYRWVLWNVNGTFITNSTREGKREYDTCEKALENAILYMIEWVKREK